MPYSFSLKTMLTSSFDNYQDRDLKKLIEIIGFLKSNGWVCRGSSDISSFSATPDGVDRWTGSVWQGVYGNTPVADEFVWYVLESTVTGHQILIETSGQLGGATRELVSIVFCVNKFEDAGAWRNAGSVASIVRPEDITSMPESGREQAPNVSWNLSAGGAPDTREYLALILRDDHRGFVCLSFDENTVVNQGIYCSSVALMDITTPDAGDDNTIVLSVMPGNLGVFPHDAPSTYGYDFILGRVGANAVKFSDCCPGGFTLLNSNFINPFTETYIETPRAFFTDAMGGFIRSSSNDCFMCNDSFLPGTTFNNKTRIIFGGATYPWDGVTAVPDRPDYLSTVFTVNASLSGGVPGQGPGPGGGGGAASRAWKFNLGLEKI